MLRESLPLILALLLPLAGAAGLMPHEPAKPPEIPAAAFFHPAASPQPTQAALGESFLQPAAFVPDLPPIAGLWLNF